MSTWGDLLTDIRADLKDIATTKKWSDELLYIYARDAIRDYTGHFPLRVERVELTDAGGYYDLPADFLGDPIVESPLDTYLEERQARPGARYPTTSLSQFHIANSKIYLNGTPNNPVYLSYNAKHVIPDNATDTACALTIEEADEELIRLYVKAKAYEQQRSRQSSLDRFAPGSGDRRDNPLSPEVDDLMGEYRSKIAERYRGGVVLLWRPGRTK